MLRLCVLCFTTQCSGKTTPPLPPWWPLFPVRTDPPQVPLLLRSPPTRKPTAVPTLALVLVPRLTQPPGRKTPALQALRREVPELVPLPKLRPMRRRGRRDGSRPRRSWKNRHGRRSWKACAPRCNSTPPTVRGAPLVVVVSASCSVVPHTNEVVVTQLMVRVPISCGCVCWPWLCIVEPIPLPCAGDAPLSQPLWTRTRVCSVLANVHNLLLLLRSRPDRAQPTERRRPDEAVRGRRKLCSVRISMYGPCGVSDGSLCYVILRSRPVACLWPLLCRTGIV
jgi:hypothetical protein